VFGLGLATEEYNIFPNTHLFIIISDNTSMV
jgi:hypothetical protein